MTDEQQTDHKPIVRDRAFWGMTITQLLGAFNDNLFKQLVLLLCVDAAISQQGDWQPVAMALFAIPFVLFSGLGGYFSDRSGKRPVIILCKVAEIGVMLLGTIAFFVGGMSPELLLILLFIVLFCMSTQSAIFGPAKYGILPELFQERDLPAVNGMVQMTTFVAIIFGMAFAGLAKERFAEQLWIVPLFCMGIGITGTITALFIRRTPVANPGLRFQASSLFVNRETRRILWADRSLLSVLCVSSLFWFLGGAVQPTVNAFGKLQMKYSDSRTSFMAACLGVGIAIGCLIASKASHHRVNFRLVKFGAWGMFGTLLAISCVGIIFDPAAPAPQIIPPEIAVPETLWATLFPQSNGEWAGRIVLTLLGIFAGLFVVPLQVFIQTESPSDQKGQIIGAMNLANWIGIFCSAAFYQLGSLACKQFTIPISGLFAVLSCIILPVALFYRPKLRNENKESRFQSA